jgi:threonine/homoserine/homoserine lactone efflux protein
VTVEIWLAYVAATTLVLIIPGPTIMLVVSYAIAEGRRAALSTVIGVGLGDFVAMTLSLAGLGALLATSAELFTILKWVGAAYLVWLGIKLWRAPAVPPGEESTEGRSGSAMMLHAFVVTALNPKGIAFFIAFTPQFLDPTAPLLPQLVIMEATFVFLGVVNAALYALLASGARERIRQPSTLRLINRIGGTVLIGAGVATAAIRRAS